MSPISRCVALLAFVSLAALAPGAEAPREMDAAHIRLALEKVGPMKDAEAERELLTTLSLCGGERTKQPDRLYGKLLSLYERKGRGRDAALVAFDRTLPRPNG